MQAHDVLGDRLPADRGAADGAGVAARAEALRARHATHHVPASDQRRVPLVLSV